MTRQRPITYTQFFTIAILSLLLLLFVLDPIRVLGWVLIPIHKYHAEQYTTSLLKNDFIKTAASMDRSEPEKTKWIEGMETFNEQDISVLHINNLKVPYDRERMDGSAEVTFAVNGKEETHRVIMNLSWTGIRQACIFPAESEFSKKWNAIQCQLPTT